MNDFLELVVGATASGCIYALVALAYLLITRPTGIINFAVGEWAMMAAFAGMVMLNQWDWPYPMGMAVMVALMFVVGWLTERLTVRPLVESGAPPLAPILSLLGMLVVFREAISIWFGPDPQAVPAAFGFGRLEWGLLAGSYQSFFIIGCTVSVFALVWYFFPIAALIIFILITAYHFGEIDWLGKTENFIHKLAYSIIGLLWILLLLSKNIHFALQIFIRMERSVFNESQWVGLAQQIYPITLIGLAAIYLILFFFKAYFFSNNKYYYYLILQQAILISFALYMPLWLCFAFYFGFWHSLLSFDKIRITFSMPNNYNGWKNLLIKAAPFSIMAWFGFVYITFLTLNSKDASGIFTLLFISLSVLALPHLQIFTKIKLKPD